MSIIELILMLAIMGFICWVILQIPMPALIKNIILGVFCFAVVIWLLQSFGLIHGVGRMRLR